MRYTLEVTPISSGYKILLEIKKKIFELEVSHDLEGIEYLLEVLDLKTYSRISGVIRERIEVIKKASL